MLYNLGCELAPQQRQGFLHSRHAGWWGGFGPQAGTRREGGADCGAGGHWSEPGRVRRSAWAEPSQAGAHLVHDDGTEHPRAPCRPRRDREVSSGLLIDDRCAATMAAAAPRSARPLRARPHSPSRAAGEGSPLAAHTSASRTAERPACGPPRPAPAARRCGAAPRGRGCGPRGLNAHWARPCPSPRADPPTAKEMVATI